ncbi:MAG: PKD domain-containing protein, partial [Thermoplasmata archaeon]|nr:PKD domain-containing protein [Thermoplasmata archaeon]
GSIRAISPATGLAKWQIGWPSIVYAAPAYSNGTVAVAGGSQFKLLNAANGKALFSFESPFEFFQSAPSIAHNRIYLDGDSGYLRVFGLPPVVSLTASPSKGIAPLTSSFSSSVTHGTPPFTYTWDFGDGSSSSSAAPSHTFANAGGYPVRLNVTDASGVTRSGETTVWVESPAPQPTIEANVTKGVAPLSVAFNSTVNQGNAPFVYAWKFGDGAASSAASPQHLFSGAGEYRVSLNVTDSDGLYGVTSVELIAHAPPPELSVSANVTSGPAPLLVAFSADVSEGDSPVTISWNFGDGSPSSSGTACDHVFRSVGEFNVSVSVSDADERNSSSTLTIDVFSPAPSVSIAASPENGSSPLNVTFTASVLGGNAPFSFFWQFGDDSNSSAASPPHVYLAPGNYTAELTLTDARGQSVHASTSVEIVAPPLNLTAFANLTTGTAPASIGFGALLSGGTAPFSYLWNFGDGGYATNTTPEHIFSAGRFTVTLNVTDASGGMVVASLMVTVNPPTLTAQLSSNRSVGPAPMSVGFAGTASGGAGALNFSWEFGDGSAGWGARPNHTFVLPGVYPVMLVVTDAFGDLASVGQNVTATDPPISLAAFSNVTSGGAALPVSFGANVSGGTAPYAYRWDFGDGNNSTMASPSHTFLLSGSYSVLLTVTDSAGGNANSSILVVVSATNASGNSTGGSGGYHAPPPGPGGHFSGAVPVADRSNSRRPN